MKKLELKLNAKKLTKEEMKGITGGFDVPNCTTTQFEGFSVTCCNNTAPCRQDIGGVNIIGCCTQ